MQEKMYVTWDELIENLDKEIELIWFKLKEQLIQDRENLKNNKNELAYV